MKENYFSNLPGQVPGTPTEQQNQNNEPPLVSKKNVFVALLDADGCTIPAHFGQYNRKKLEETNQHLLAFLKKQFSENKHQRIIFALGTNRQDYNTDLEHQLTHQSFSCVWLLPFFLRYFKKSNDVVIDPIMMGDIFSIHNNHKSEESVKPGSTFAITQLNGKSSERDLYQAKFDKNKVPIIYMHAHRAALQNPHSNITISLFDDQKNILETLKTFFTENTELLPNNVKLSLYLYECGEKVSEFTTTPIQGSGLCDENYDRTIQLISLITAEKNSANYFKHTTRQLFDDFMSYLTHHFHLYTEMKEDSYPEESSMENESDCQKLMKKFNSHLLFEKIGKESFFEILRHMRSKDLNSGLVVANYPNSEDLLALYNKMNDQNSDSDLSLSGFKKMLSLSQSIKSASLSNPKLFMSESLLEGVALKSNSLTNDNKNYKKQNVCAAATAGSCRYEESTHSEINASKKEDSIMHSPASESYMTTNKGGNNPNAIFPETPMTTVTANHTHTVSFENYANINSDIITPGTPMTIAAEGKDKKINSPLSHSKLKKKPRGIFSSLFTGICCEEDGCCVRDNTLK